MEVDVDLWKEKSSKQDSIYASTEFTSFGSHFWVLISAGKGPHFTQRWVPIGSPFWNVLAQPSPYLVDPLPNAPTVLTLTFTKGAECETPRSRMQNRSRMRNTMSQLHQTLHFSPRQRSRWIQTNYLVSIEPSFVTHYIFNLNHSQACLVGNCFWKQAFTFFWPVFVVGNPSTSSEKHKFFPHAG